MTWIHTDNITRVEVIDEGGRAFSVWNVNVDAKLQDQGRTLKLFVTDNGGEASPFDFLGDR